MTIWKFPLHLRGVQTVPMPKGAMPLSVAYQGCQLCLWATVTMDAPTEDVTVFVLETGDLLPEDAHVFIGTAVYTDILPVAARVWHVWTKHPWSRKVNV